MVNTKMAERQAREKLELEAFEDESSEPSKYFQEAFDAATQGNKNVADRQVKKLLQIKTRLESEIAGPNVEAPIGSDIKRDKLIEGYTGTASASSSKSLCKKKIKVLNPLIASLQIIYKKNKWDFPD